MRAMVKRVTVVMEATRIKAGLSTARIVPNRTWIRSTLVPRMEMIRTPRASEIRYRAAKLASSRRAVSRVMAPASRATVRPTTMPPMVIA